MVKNSVISMDKLKAIWHSEVHDEQKWAVNMRYRVSELNVEFDSFVCFERPNQSKLVRALGMFAGGVFLMRSYGDLMAL